MQLHAPCCFVRVAYESVKSRRSFIGTYLRLANLFYKIGLSVMISLISA